MSNSSEQNNHKPAGLPSWADCDLFCIHDYAGTVFHHVAGAAISSENSKFFMSLSVGQK